MFSLLFTLASVVVALSLAQGKQGTASRWGNIRRRNWKMPVVTPLPTPMTLKTRAPTPRPTSAPTPIPIPPNDANIQCEWWKAGMTWDCNCHNSNGGKNWEHSIEEKWKQTNWFFTPCAREGYSCDDARRRKKFAALCGSEAFGANGELGQQRTTDSTPNRNFKALWDDYGVNTMGVAVFSIKENADSYGKRSEQTYKTTFWDDWLHEQSSWAQGKQRCVRGGDNNCKCTCVSAANMIGTGGMKALLPYRGPGDVENYITPGCYAPAENFDNNDATHCGGALGDIDIMYATYCIGVCGADCDSAGSQTVGDGRSDLYDRTKWSEPIDGGQRNAGENTLYAVLVSHDVCQAYIGSKKSYTNEKGRLNGCGDEAYQNGACYAAEYSMRDIGGSCDTDQQWAAEGSNAKSCIGEGDH